MRSHDPAKVLIVDDLAENLQALDALLRDEQRQVIHARSGDEALALLLEHEFALAILDVQMPGLGGFEVARRLLERDEDPPNGRARRLERTDHLLSHRHRNARRVE